MSKKLIDLFHSTTKPLEKTKDVVSYTSEQWVWLRKKAGDIGDSINSVQQALVQEKIQAEKDIADQAKQVLT